MTPLRPRWFSSPRTRLSADSRGITRAAYVQLREAVVVRVVQPDLDHPVFVYLGVDDLPVGIKFTAPLSCAIEGKMTLYLGTTGKVTQKMRYSLKPLPPRVLEPAMRVARQASRALERALG